ncbi:uncharacterized protein LOC110919537 [Helianthus annuus]|uniref:uncharacterized protein LOC110919537 n=1 Tax=Helianthus annuus TaxID=4232 RepID=UPI000B907248|nr:uncharacterized protein LOC110919537 [Helianthus annuus]
MNFVHGTSSESHKESHFSRQTNEEFITQKKQHEQAKGIVVVKDSRTCFRCNEAGHIARKCPQQKPKLVYVEKKKSEDLIQKLPMFATKQIWKRINESNNKDKPVKQNVSTKHTGESLKENIQKDSKFYIKNFFSESQTWVVKKKENSNGEKLTSSAEKVEKVISKNVSFCKPKSVAMPKESQTWVVKKKENSNGEKQTSSAEKVEKVISKNVKSIGWFKETKRTEGTSDISMRIICDA